MKQLYLHIKLAALSMLLFSACTQDEIMNQANGHSRISPWQYNHVIQRLWTL